MRGRPISAMKRATPVTRRRSSFRRRGCPTNAWLGACVRCVTWVTTCIMPPQDTAAQCAAGLVLQGDTVIERYCRTGAHEARLLAITQARTVDLSHRVTNGMRVYPGVPPLSISAFLTHEQSRARYDGQCELTFSQVTV